LGFPEIGITASAVCVFYRNSDSLKKTHFHGIFFSKHLEESKKICYNYMM
jgi:hypothetical protein